MRAIEIISELQVLTKQNQIYTAILAFGRKIIHAHTTALRPGNSKQVSKFSVVC